ncbi:MAG: nucleotidyltransferase domain-containing protein [Vallitalea sp.]|jgi:predicted nucleotidyltransferase|nr:nucleotidyltransferase domain-containing protein [Vallitalea sp.]
MRLKKIISCFFICILIFTACSRKSLEFESIANHVNVVEESEYGKIKMEFSKLDGEDIRSFSAKEGKTYAFEYAYLITEGTIELQFRDSQDNVITKITLSEDEYKEAKKELKKDNDVEVYEFGSTIQVKSNDKKIKIAIIGKDSIHNILKILKSEEEVLGILLSGSIAHGFDTPVSDIDIMIIISEENYRKRAEEGKLTYYEKESCTYEEGYVDGKYISISFMEKVALIGSEPAKFAFDGAVILYSKIEGLEELLQKITKYPIEKKEENIKRFYAQFEAYKWYCNEAIKHENDYLLMHSISNMVLFGGSFAKGNINIKYSLMLKYSCDL